MSRYSIEGSTLTAIGDAIRDRVGDTKIILVYNKPVIEVIKSDNATGMDSWQGSLPSYPSRTKYGEVNFPDAKKIKIKIGWFFTTSASYITVFDEANKEINYGYLKSYPGDVSSGEPKYQEEIFNTNHLSFQLDHPYEGSNSFFYIECYPLDENNNEILVESDTPREIVVFNSMTPTQMAEEINNFPPSLPNEAFILTGDCSYRFAYNSWNWFIKNYWDKVTTRDISATQYMFYNCAEVEQIPFDINMTPNNNGNAIMYMFYNCVKLKNIPKIKGVKVKELNGLFRDCHNLREATEDFYEDWDWSLLDGSTNSYTGNSSTLFASCYSLRKYPNSFLAHGNSMSTYSYTIYNNLFTNCYSLDEIVNLPIQHRDAAWTATYSNAFSAVATYCCRLKNFTFETNDDGSPIVIKNWANQVIDLSQAVGYATQVYMENGILNHNSGITVDKKVTNDASYQALKNDPDWYTRDVKYSRYNHNSAVATINSLPDVSAKTGNTIKFKGAAGELTDGGAINTLTEEEIAVATAKGWTVSLS